MFAVGDIIKGEQLTFDYRQGGQIGMVRPSPPSFLEPTKLEMDLD